MEFRILSFDLEIQTGKVSQWDRQCSFQRLGIAPSQLGHLPTQNKLHRAFSLCMN